MRRSNPISSGAFRFAVAIAAVFAFGSVVLLVIVEQAVSHYAAEALSDSVSAETDILVGEDRAQARAELVRAVTVHEGSVRERQFRYLLLAPGGRRLAGSLPLGEAKSGWRRFSVRDPTDPEQHNRPIPLLAQGVRLDDGALLVVAGDMSDLNDLGAGLGRFTLVFGLLVTALALIGGLIVGGVFLRRLDSVNRAIERIVEGSFSERLPSIGIAPEFDLLSANLNRMLTRIEALMEGLRQVSTDIAHDLRTPLSRLRQRLERMQATAGWTPLAADVDAAIEQTDDLLAIFAALLRIGALESHGNREHFRPVPFGELARRVFDAFEPVAQDLGHALTLDIVGEPLVLGDAELLTQAASNLIENAITHTPVGSAIQLIVEQREGVVRLIVADDGPGIAEEERGRVLRRFYRLDRSRSTPGAGLGLALVAAIVALHDAEFELLDNRPGLRLEITFQHLGEVSNL